MKATLVVGLPFLALALALPGGAETGLGIQAASTLPFVWAALAAGLVSPERYAFQAGVTALPFSAWSALYLASAPYETGMAPLAAAVGASAACYAAAAAVAAALSAFARGAGRNKPRAFGTLPDGAFMAAAALAHGKWGSGPALAFAAFAGALAAFAIKSAGRPR